MYIQIAKYTKEEKHGEPYLKNIRSIRLSCCLTPPNGAV